jgi:hypothetical protein
MAELQTRRCLMNRYLVQFREYRCDHFVTDCAFREVHRAILYVQTVVDTLDYVAEGQVLDAETKTCVYRYAVGEELVVAVFGKPEPFEDVNGSDGIDDDPFVQYGGPDDPAIRYS